MGKMVFKTTDLKTLKKGDYSIFTKTLSDTDAMLFAGISGEMSPLFLNETFASETPLKTRTVHPMLAASLAGAAVLKLLQPATRSVSRQFEFLLPVYAGDTVTALAEVEDIREEKKEVVVRISCYNQKEEMLLKGLCVEQLIGNGGEE